ncbi:hypothetical protein MIB92_01440 [Aestuariirhabdus sp. Z084]|uniref:hypothetical protein n=1 Tax=Aestuariirhabdus haliotis TaxID=2918751 RepID=UPI00201B383A|nr:hypothetical protein [Aestuariirhabdus haliotis]MCL6414301.1 hypothetical protein [Aestuariirhabdus haliotis]MCL6418233.1 hypothetical protein [Aestuariirhabdus haliotis]
MITSACKYLLIGAAIASTVVASAQAAEVRYFRFKNEAGSVVISPNLPPEYASKGYSIINSKGRVLEEVPPALTSQQLLEKREEEIRLLAAEGEKAQKRSSDAALMKLYSTIPDIERARERAIADIEDRIKLTNANIARQRKLREEKEATAATRERAGKPVPERILRDIASIDEEIERLMAEIDRRRQDQVFVGERFDRDTLRLKKLLGIVDDQGQLVERKAVESLRPEQLGGIWHSRDKLGNRYEWIINPKGSFSWVSKQIDGSQLMILGSWGVEKGVLVIDSEMRQISSPDGTTNHGPSDEQHLATVISITEDKFVVVTEEGEELRFLRNN